MIWLKGKKRMTPDGKVVIFPKCHYEEFPLFVLSENPMGNMVKNSFRLTIAKRSRKKFLVEDESGDLFFDIQEWVKGEKIYTYKNNPYCVEELIGINSKGEGRRLSLLRRGINLQEKEELK